MEEKELIELLQTLELVSKQKMDEVFNNIDILDLQGGIEINEAIDRAINTFPNFIFISK